MNQWAEFYETLCEHCVIEFLFKFGPNHFIVIDCSCTNWE